MASGLQTCVRGLQVLDPAAGRRHAKPPRVFVPRAQVWANGRVEQLHGRTGWVECLYCCESSALGGCTLTNRPKRHSGGGRRW